MTLSPQAAALRLFDESEFRYREAMPRQSRAVETRQKIIDAAVGLFADKGYGETGLNDLTARAGVTTGAFYYHFSSKEALATAIMDQGWPKALDVVTRCLQPPSPGLENVIVMTFALSDLMKQDKSVWVANHLNQAFGQLSEEGRRVFEDHAATFIDRLAAAVRGTDLNDGTTPEQVGSMVWITLHGCHLLSDAMDDSVIDRLRESWSLLLRSIVPDESLPYFKRFLSRTASEYDSASAAS